MGHRVGKDIYRKLGRKIDHLTLRAPWNETFHAILKDLYSREEADIVVKMPYGLSTFDRVARVTKCEPSNLRRILESLCAKGLVMDLWIGGEYRYIPSPLIVGIFEFTMMRTGEAQNSRKWARLFHAYLHGDDSFFAANCKKGDKVSVMRTLPHGEAVRPSEYIEVLDYEKAEALVRKSNKLSMGFCACRHEKHHLGKKECDAPLDNCSSFGQAADILIRHNFAREVSRTEMLENLVRSKEMGLVLNADNVKRNISFLCHCCKCCCYALSGISKFGYASTIVTSNFIAETDKKTCAGCGQCAKACPIQAIKMIPIKEPKTKKKKDPKLDRSFCLGCGVCALKCKTGALKLVPRGQRVLHPETTFERLILQCLEKGTLQYQIFDDPQSHTHQFMRTFIGAFLRLPPVKKGLMSEMFRSSFLDYMTAGVRKQGKGSVTEV